MRLRLVVLVVGGRSRSRSLGLSRRRSRCRIVAVLRGVPAYHLKPFFNTVVHMTSKASNSSSPNFEELDVSTDGCSEHTRFADFVNRILNQSEASCFSA